MTAAIDLAFAKLELADTIVVKALKVSELTQMARIETRLREFMHAKWSARAKKAIARASKLVGKGKSVEAVVDAINKIMEPWANEIVPTYNRSIGQIYKLGREVGWKRATGQIKGDRALMFTTENFSEGQTIIKAVGDFEVEALPSFDVVDQGAVKQLNKQNTFWIGKHYDTNVAESIATTTRDTMVVAGASRAVAAEALAAALAVQFGKISIPGGYHGSSKSYFEGVSANSATVARVAGQVRSFELLDVSTLEIINPMDKRTSPQCAHMNGKVFTVEQARAQLDAEMGAASPDDVKTVHPWMSMDQMKSVSPKAGPAGTKDAQELFGNQVTLPPYHFRCRTTVDVSSFAKEVEAPAGVVPKAPPKAKVPAPPKPKGKPKLPSPGKLAAAARALKKPKPLKGAPKGKGKKPAVIFAEPLPVNAPGVAESKERFFDRMAAHGNKKALTKYNALRAKGMTHEQAAKAMRSPAKVVPPKPKPKTPPPVAKRTWVETPPPVMGPHATTFDKHFTNGVPSAARKKLHDSIVAKALADVPAIPVGGPRTAIVTMGGPGSGKSFALRSLDKKRYVFADPDDVKGLLPEYVTALNPKATFRGAARMAHEESSYVASRIVQESVAAGRPLVIDGTGKSLDKMLAKIEHLKANGYKVKVVMPHLDEATGVKRVIDRAERSGRMVPEEIVRAAYKQIPKNFPKVVAAVDDFALFDGTTGTVIASGGRGKAVEVASAKALKAFEDKFGEFTAARRAWTETPPAIMGTHKTTLSKHFKKDGTPKAARRKLHDRIVAEALGDVPKIPLGGPRTAILTMGGPGSGKSFALRSLDKKRYVFADPDAVKDALPEYAAALNPKATFRGAARMAHEESSYVASRVVSEAVAEGRPIVIDGTGKSLDKMLDKIEHLKANGYKVKVVMPHLDEATGVQRVIDRAERSGRMVPEEIVRAAYKQIPKNFPKIANSVDDFALFDGINGTQVASGGAGKTLEVGNAKALKAFEAKFGTFTEPR